MAQLNQLQQELIAFISEQHLPSLKILRQLLRLNEGVKDVKTLTDNLGDAILGHSQACQQIANELPNLKNLPKRYKISLEDQTILNNFFNLVEKLTTAVTEQSIVFSCLTSQQQTAIRCLFESQFIAAQLIYPKKGIAALKLMDELKELASGKESRTQLFIQLFSMLKNTENIHFNCKENKEFFSNYLKNLSSGFFKPSILNRIAGGFLGLLMFGILFPIAHNPIYHFIHLFRSRKSKTFHLGHILTSPIFPLIGIVMGCGFGYQFGVPGLLHHFAFVTGKHYIGLTIISLLIISAAIATAFFTLFFPPAAPLLVAQLPLLLSLSPVLLAIVTGIATEIVLTAVASIATMIYACIKDYQSIPEPMLVASIPATKPAALADTNPPVLADTIAAQALGEPADFKPVLTPAVTTTDTSAKNDDVVVQSANVSSP